MVYYYNCKLFEYTSANMVLIFRTLGISGANACSPHFYIFVQAAEFVKLCDLHL